MAPKGKQLPKDGGHVANQKKTPKMPAAVAAVRAKMEELQVPLTSCNLKDMLTAKEYNVLGNSFRNSMTSEEKKGI